MIGDWVYFLFIPLIGLWPEDMAGPLWPRALPLHYPTLVLHQRERERRSDQRVLMLRPRAHCLPTQSLDEGRDRLPFVESLRHHRVIISPEESLQV